MLCLGQPCSLRCILPLQPGASGEYLDSERITRDPNRLAVGGWTDPSSGQAVALPEAQPRAAYALAAAVAALGAASELVEVPPLAMVSVELGLGANWQLLTASVQPVGLLDGIAAAAALATAGVYAERRLGTLLFTAAFFLSGAATWTLCLAESLLYPVPVEASGPAAPLLGCAALLGAAAASNWSVLGAAQQRGAAAAAVAGLAAASLLDTLVYNTLAAVFVLPLGGLLGLVAGPRLVVQEGEACGPLAGASLARHSAARAWRSAARAWRSAHRPSNPGCLLSAGCHCRNLGVSCGSAAGHSM